MAAVNMRKDSGQVLQCECFYLCINQQNPEVREEVGFCAPYWSPPLQCKESADTVVRRAGGKALQSWVVIPFRPRLPASFPIPQFNLWCCIKVEEFYSRLKPTCIRAISLQPPTLTTFCRDQSGRFNLLTANFSWFFCSHAQSDGDDVWPFLLLLSAMQTWWG